MPPKPECKKGYYKVGGTCCPNGMVLAKGKCCPPGYLPTTGKKCCPKGTVLTSGKCCPPGKTVKGLKCVTPPTEKPPVPPTVRKYTFLIDVDLKLSQVLW